MKSLIIENLSVGYGSRTVLDNFQFRLQAGQFCALLGPNGSGKSTLLRAISGVLPPKSGSIRYAGVDLVRCPAKQRAKQIAVVPQALSLPTAFTVSEVVLMGRAPHLSFLGQEQEHDCKVAWDAMLATEVAEHADRRVDELSGGELQRTVIARALAQEPEIFLLDEPTSHLDLQHQISTLNLILDLVQKRQLVAVMSMHDLNLAARYAHQVALLHEGKLVRVGTPEEVLQEDLLQQVYGVEVTVRRDESNNELIILPRGAPQPKTSNS